MESINTTLAANILKYRKKCGLTQEELAGKLGVSYQAVSKWENAKSAPDIAFLPVMADIFECYIDELFSREIKQEVHYDHCPQFPWADDTVLRGVVCEGRKILKVTDGLVDKFTFEIVGEAKNVQSECNVAVNGSVSGGCKAGKTITVDGGVSGGCNAGHTVSISKSLSGGCNAGNSVSVGGNLSGGCNSGFLINCKGNILGNVSTKGSITVGGNVKAEKITGNVSCNVCECEKITGELTISNKPAEIKSDDGTPIDYSDKESIMNFVRQQVENEYGKSEDLDKMMDFIAENAKDGVSEGIKITGKNADKFWSSFGSIFRNKKK